MGALGVSAARARLLACSVQSRFFRLNALRPDHVAFRDRKRRGREPVDRVARFALGLDPVPKASRRAAEAFLQNVAVRRRAASSGFADAARAHADNRTTQATTMPAAKIFSITMATNHIQADAAHVFRQERRVSL